MTNQDLEHIGAYLRGELNEEQRQLLEDRLEQDADFESLFRLEKAQFEALSDGLWSTDVTANEELEQYKVAARSQAVRNLNAQLESRRSGNSDSKVIPLYKRPLFKWVAAVVLIALVMASLLLGGKRSPETLYAQYIDLDDVPSLTSRSNEDSLLTNFETVFKAGNYRQFITEVETISNREDENASLLIYKGLSYLELNNAEAALNSFDDLIESDLLDAPRGYWFKALAFLKTGQSEKAREVLQLLVEADSYKAEEAAEILQKLK